MSGKWSLQEQGIRLPFIVRWPGKIKPNTTSETLLTLVDVLPTILEVSKTKIPRELDGKSFVESLKGDDKQINEYVYGVATRQNIRECKIFPSVKWILKKLSKKYLLFNKRRDFEKIHTRRIFA